MKWVITALAGCLADSRVLFIRPRLRKTDVPRVHICCTFWGDASDWHFDLHRSLSVLFLQPHSLLCEKVSGEPNDGSYFIRWGYDDWMIDRLNDCIELHRGVGVWIWIWCWCVKYEFEKKGEKRPTGSLSPSRAQKLWRGLYASAGKPRLAKSLIKSLTSNLLSSISGVYFLVGALVLN